MSAVTDWINVWISAGVGCVCLSKMLSRFPARARAQLGGVCPNNKHLARHGLSLFKGEALKQAAAPSIFS